MKKTALLLFVSLLICLVVPAQPNRRATAGRTPDTITGQYVLRYSNVRGTLNVQLLPNDQVKFSLVALLLTGGGETRNGEVEATVPLDGNTAVYEEGECKITLKFLNNSVVVAESHVDDCGFGAFVTARGTYTRKSHKPKFDS